VKARPDIPGHEQQVSSVELAGRKLAVRLVTDLHPGIEAGAYRLEIEGVADPEAVQSFLEHARSEEEFVYVSWREEFLVFETEHGSELQVTGTRFAGEKVELNASELQSALKRVYGWYLAENESSRRLQSKLQAARELLLDQASRVRVKASSHAPDSAVGVLYAQQLAFLERMTRETEV
jgi:hypothetical protein